MARRDEGEYPYRSLTEEQQSQTVFCATTRRAAVLLPVYCVGSVVWLPKPATSWLPRNELSLRDPWSVRVGDVPPSPPCTQPKSHAVAPQRRS